MNSLGCKDSDLKKYITVSEDNADDGGNNDDNGDGYTESGKDGGDTGDGNGEDSGIGTEALVTVDFLVGTPRIN